MKVLNLSEVWNIARLYLSFAVSYWQQKLYIWSGPVLRGFDPQTLFFMIETPKGTSLAETASYEPLSVAIGWGVSLGRRDKNTKKNSGRTNDMTNWVLAPPTPLIRS